MRKIAPAEMLELTSLLSMEATTLANAKTVLEMIKNDELKRLLDSFIQISEGKVKDIQQFVNENGIIREVH